MHVTNDLLYSTVHCRDNMNEARQADFATVRAQTIALKNYNIPSCHHSPSSKSSTFMVGVLPCSHRCDFGGMLLGFSLSSRRCFIIRSKRDTRTAVEWNLSQSRSMSGNFVSLSCDRNKVALRAITSSWKVRLPFLLTLILPPCTCNDQSNFCLSEERILMCMTPASS